MPVNLERILRVTERILGYAIDDHGLETVKAAIAQRGDLYNLLSQLVGNAPPPESELAPFSISNNQLLKEGRVYKFLGMNYRELPFFGLGLDPIKWTTDAHFFQQLDGATAKKCKAIRVFCSHPALTVEQTIPRLKRVLDEAAKRGLYVILCLTDGASGGAFHVPESADLRTDRYTWKWILGGWKTGKYYRFVDEVTKALGDHPAVFSFEPVNELTALSWPLTDEQANGMLAFWKDVTALIRKNAPKKLISSGSISSWELFVERAYANGNYALRMANETDLNLISFHSYPVGQDVLGETGQHIRNEVNLLKANNVRRVAFMLEETAARWDSGYVETSVDPVKRQVDALLGMGFVAAFLWGVSFPYGQDIGVHGAGYPNWNSDPLAARWHNAIGGGWFPAVATDLERAFGE